MSTEQTRAVETDPRFPSGRWLGFFLDARAPGRQQMELDLTFRDGALSGDGRDYVGRFLIRGRYELEDGHCDWTKLYVGQHAVAYRGFNEGRGIWGTWEIGIPGGRITGGFQIWPEGMADPTQRPLEEEADSPLSWDSLAAQSPSFGDREPAVAERKGAGSFPDSVASLPMNGTAILRMKTRIARAFHPWDVAVFRAQAESPRARREFRRVSRNAQLQARVAWPTCWLCAPRCDVAGEGGRAERRVVRRFRTANK